MNSEIRTTTRFRREAKRLSKKFSSLKNDLQLLHQDLTNNPKLGTPLGKNFFKIRLQIKSKGQGKSGGARVISHLEVTFTKDSLALPVVYLATIYDKSETSTVSDKELKRLLSEIREEFST
jgi:hypothetical protein